MPNITIKRSVIIKVKVTEKFITETIEQLKEALERVNLELEQIEFREKKMIFDAEKHPRHQLSDLKQQIETERKKRLELKTKLLEKIKEVEKWEIGSEIIKGTVEGLVEVHEGDNWDSIMSSEVVIEDGKVIKII